MKHIPLLVDDVPPLPLVIERRRIPDRRAVWRGGRRDGDWLVRRPPGQLDVFRTDQPPDRWRELRATLSVFF